MIQSPPKISVLVPCYNVEKYVRQCVESIISQTMQDIEIICINDGSTDNTLQILQSYAAADKRIKIIDKPNSGYGASMNIGLSVATGDYIGIVESDDWIEPEMFADLYGLAAKNNVDVVKSNYYLYWSTPAEKNEFVHAIPEDDINEVISPLRRQRIFGLAPAIWSAIYKRAFLETNNIKFLETPGASYQDTAFNFKVWATAEKAFLTNKAYLHYRQDNENSSVRSPNKVYCVCDEYHEIEKFISEHNQTEQLLKLVQRLKYSTYMWNLGRLSFPLNWQFLKVMSKEFASAQKQGLLDKNIFGKKPYKNVKRIIKHPKLFIVKTQIKRMKRAIRSKYNYWNVFSKIESKPMMKKIMV